jgi:hypothetical protein
VDAGPRSSVERSGGSLWWMLPARLIGRIRPVLASATAADARVLGTRDGRLVGLALPLGVIVLALIPSILHATTYLPRSQAEVDLLRIRMDDTYTESLLFMAIAVVLGTLSPALGAFLVLVFGVADLVAASMQPLELVSFPDALVGRLISYWLLWVLVVEIPLLARGLVRRRSGGAVSHIRGVIVGTLATGGFVYLWTLGVPLLIRPIFSLSQLTPKAVMIYPLQHAGWVVALTASVAAAAFFLWRSPDQLLEPVPVVARGQPRREIEIARRIVIAALLTISLAGIVSTSIEAVLLFVALVGIRPAATFLMQRTGLAGLVSRLPDELRVIVAAAAALGTAVLVVTRLYHQNDEDFFPIVVGLIAAMAAAEVILVRPKVPDSRSASAPAVSAVAAGLLIAVALLAFSFLAPAVVFADDCSTLGDCFGGWALGAAMATGGAAMNYALRGWKLSSGPPSPPPPSPPPLVQQQPMNFFQKAFHQWSGSQQSDEANWGPTSNMVNPNGACFLTTTCVQALGKPDDCHELEMWRQMRDDFLRRQPDGMVVIADYYRTAPGVIAAVLASTDPGSVWPRIYAELVEPVVELVDAGRLDAAAELAEARYEVIKRRYSVA